MSVHAATVTPDGLVFRDTVRMLGDAGPLNPPMRTLFVDGSPESEFIFAVCENAGVDYSLVLVDPGEGVVWHDHLLYCDYHGLANIRSALAFAQKLYGEMDSLIDEALPESMRLHSPQDQEEARARLELERAERKRLMEEAVARFQQVGATSG